MAYNRTYYFNFVSDQGLTYRVEMYADVAASSYQNKEGTLGPGAASVKYGSDGSKLFAPLKPSTFTLEFMVTDLNSAQYIHQLRTARKERDVYVNMYRETVSGTNNPVYAPIWGGYLLMDLADDPDEAVPYPITLKAIDGLASLKYYDFIPSTTTQNADHLYDIGDTFISDAANSGGQYDVWRTFLDLISICMANSGTYSTTTGSNTDPGIKTAVRWYNGEHLNTTIDPLAQTRAKPDIFYTQQEIDEDTIKYKAKSCYDVLKAICRAWGMRVFYWRNKWYFIQINQWDESQSGTQASPDDIHNHGYTMAGGSASTSNSIQGFWGTYSLPLTNATQSSTSDVRNFKLSGGQYGTLPALKKVNIEFMSVDNVNRFTAFPLIPGYSGAATLQNWFRWKSLGAFTFDGTTDQSFYQRIILEVQNNSSGTGTIQLFWGLFARPAGTGSNAPSASPQDNGYTHMMGMVGTAGSAPYTPTWFLNTPAPNFWPSASLMYNGDDIIYPQSNFHNITPGLNSIDITDNTGATGNYNYVECPASVFTAGDWEFTYYCRNWWHSSSILHSHGKVNLDTVAASNPFSANVSYTNSQLTQGLYSSVFSPIIGGVIGNTSVTTTLSQSGSDTEVENIKGVLFGDTGNNVSEGSIQIYTGSVWQQTEFDGAWGIDTLAGTNSFSEQLAQDILNARGKIIKKFTVQTTTDPTESIYFNDGSANRPQFAWPGTKWLTPSHSASGTQAAKWMMHTADWFPKSDTWKWNLYEQEEFSITTVSTTVGTGGLNSGNYGGTSIPAPSGSGSLVGPPGGQVASYQSQMIQQLQNHQPRPIARINANQIITPAAGTNYEQTITSLTVSPIPTAVFRIGDVLAVQTTSSRPVDTTATAVYTDGENIPLTFTVSANQAADDTSISVISQVINRDILIGDTISFDTTHLIAQYQNKTEGTIAGMPVGGTDLGPILYFGEYYITGVNTTYIKILPRDFMVNDDSTTGYEEALNFKDSAVNSGVQVGTALQEMIATVDIPYNTKATTVYIWGSNATKVVEVYAGGVSTNGIGSVLGSGLTDGEPITITATTATPLNYLLILVKVSAVSQRVYGGQVTLTTIL